MSDPTPVGKLKRSYLLHFIDSTFGGQSPSWFLIGRDIEDMSVELNPDTSIKKNILDQTVAEDNGYEPSISADTYYANTGDAIYSKLKDIAMNRKTGEDCATKVMEVIIDDDGSSHSAWVEDCVVKPQSYGGGQGAVNIPFNIYFNGNRTVGTAAKTGTPAAWAFTPAS